MYQGCKEVLLSKPKSESEFLNFDLSESEVEGGAGGRREIR